MPRRERVAVLPRKSGRGTCWEGRIVENIAFRVPLRAVRGWGLGQWEEGAG